MIGYKAFDKNLQCRGFPLGIKQAREREHKKLLKLPNWNNEIFKEISGIDAEAEIAKEV